MPERAELGLFTEFQCPAGMSEAAAFEESMAQMRAAEELGFDAVWLGELHFQKERSVLASPLVVAAAIAACTRRVKIGIAVQVLPLSHPWRLAEDVATVDHLSRGRLDFGVGRSGLPGHYTGFNIPYEESRDRFAETLEILLKAWTQERFSHEGRYYRFRDVCLMPKPYQKPHPPIRIAATTEETYPMVGRLGYPVFVAVRTSAISHLERFIGGYHEAWRAAGHPGRGNVALLVPVFVAETAREAREVPAASTMHWFRSISPGAGAGGPPGQDDLRRHPRRAGGLRHAGDGRGAARGAARDAGVLQPVGVDEQRGPDPARPRAGLDAPLRRAGGAAAGLRTPG
jgi:alkanesulfonate monooxygenase SsuD/methylene tetrahydromethanopterin reductase-like flavin-dependent oxidoreductase (luciferase family)